MGVLSPSPLVGKGAAGRGGATSSGRRQLHNCQCALLSHPSLHSRLPAIPPGSSRCWWCRRRTCAAAWTGAAPWMEQLGSGPPRWRRGSWAGRGGKREGGREACGWPCGAGRAGGGVGAHAAGGAAKPMQPAHQRLSPVLAPPSLPSGSCRLGFVSYTDKASSLAREVESGLREHMVGPGGSR